ncbi:MAG TPA: diacylglycerol kinase family protein [Armatimonadota bacterium]|jgi:YegS/Rv2252/BmrU family lipid kinase
MISRLVICNPQARLTRTQSAADGVRDLLATAGLPAEIVVAGDWAEAARVAREAVQDGYQQVIAAGGDGTVNAVANGLQGSAAALGVLPLGTGNILAYNLGVERLPAALEALRENRCGRLDLGCVNGRYFAAVAGVGFDAQVAHRVHPLWKQQIGRVAFLTEGLAQRTHVRPHTFRVELEGEHSATLEGPMWSAFFSNVPQHTWNLPLAQKAGLDDGWLHLILFEDARAWDFVYGLGSALVSGDLSQAGGVSVHRVTRARITTDPPWIWEADGDVGGPTPVEVSVHPAAVQVVLGATA